MVAVEIDLVADSPLSEFRVYHCRNFESLREKASPSIDLPQPSLAVLIVGVFNAIAVN